MGIKVLHGMSIKPSNRKQCQDPKGILTLDRIGSLYCVTLSITDDKLADECKHGGYDRTYWGEFWEAESMYDQHLEWFKAAALEPKGEG